MADEEEDEEVCDSWEDMADSGELERRMEERNKLQIQKEIKAVTNDIPVKVAVVMQEDTSRTQYKPQLRILKRPDFGKDCMSGAMGSDKNDAPARKSLAERQAQYAEARARILGSACDDSAETTSSLAEEEMAIEAAAPFLLQMSEDNTKLPENVIRQPVGPNGTKGFTTRR